MIRLLLHLLQILLLPRCFDCNFKVSNSYNLTRMEAFPGMKFTNGMKIIAMTVLLAAVNLAGAQDAMASSGDVNQAVKSTLRECKDRAEKEDALKLTPFVKCLEACGMENYKLAVESSIWNLHADKAKKISIDKIVSHVILDIAADAVARKKGIKARAPHDDPDVVKMADDIKAKFAAKAGQAVYKSDATIDRMTDTSQKERFDKDEEGKGREGRVEKTNDSGYVGNFKNESTYDSKK